MPFWTIPLLTYSLGETAVRTNRAGAEGSSFLERERAVLGDDASQFTTSGENIQAATVEDGDDDLLGGEFSSDNHPADAPPHTGQEISDFESSFPAVDTQNTVSSVPIPFLLEIVKFMLARTLDLAARSLAMQLHINPQLVAIPTTQHLSRRRPNP